MKNWPDIISNLAISSWTYSSWSNSSKSYSSFSSLISHVRVCQIQIGHIWVVQFRIGYIWSDHIEVSLSLYWSNSNFHRKIMLTSKIMNLPNSSFKSMTSNDSVFIIDCFISVTWHSLFLVLIKSYRSIILENFECLLSLDVRRSWDKKYTVVYRHEPRIEKISLNSLFLLNIRILLN